MFSKICIIGQPKLQVAAPNEFTNQDNHGHSHGLLQKVSKANMSFTPGLDKHHRGNRTTPHAPSISLTLSQEHQKLLPDITTKIPAQATSDHAHLEEHQRLIKRRSRATRKERQGG
jgi:hypothetical protein